MNSRVREDEKHEMIIRKLLKNTENKRCINCGSLGPQYVCTNFSIFVCTYCSGAHREFSHRIKSISMAKFTSGEVANLQSGGNGRAREIYFKELDLLRNPLPDSSDSLKLRNFINHVYVERRYTGDRPVPTKIQDGSRDDYESRRLEIRKLGFQSLSREDKNHDRRNNERFGYHARKSDAGGYHNEKLSPNGFEPDKPTRKSYDDCEGRLDERVNPEATREKAKLPFRPFAFRNCEDDGSSVRSVKEILGDDVPSLRVDLNGRTVPGIITAPGGRSECLNHSCNGDATAPVPAVKRVSSESMFSLIDFSGDPEPLVASGAAADPFPPTSADKPVSDPFATTPALAAAPPCANASVLNLFGSDPFAVAADAKPAAEPFASVPTLKRASDPFGFGDQGASDNSENPSWAAFDFTVNSVPPEGYPGAFLANNVTTSIPTQVFEGAAWDTSSSAGNCGWSAFGLLTPAPPELVPGITPAPLAASFGQSVMQVQMGFPPQLITPDKLQAPSSASGRVRRELPQDFFSQPSVFGKDTRQDLAFSMGVGHIGAPQIPQRGHQVAAQPSRTRNPFDDDLPPAPFNMGSIQAALPQVGNPLSGVASQWSQSIPQVQSTATPAVAFGYGMHLTSTMHQQNGQSGGFGQNQAFNGSMFGGSPFYSHTAGSNPFD